MVLERHQPRRKAKNGFDLISVAEPDLLQDDPSRKLMRQIFGVIAEYEKTMIVLKLRGARVRTRAKTGRCEGRKPYGYFEGENAVIDRMQELRKAGQGFDKIAAALNSEGFKPRSGEKWYGSAVNGILTREAFPSNVSARKRLDSSTATAHANYSISEYGSKE